MDRKEELELLIQKLNEHISELAVETGLGAYIMSNDTPNLVVSKIKSVICNAVLNGAVYFSRSHRIIETKKQILDLSLKKIDPSNPYYTLSTFSYAPKDALRLENFFSYLDVYVRGGMSACDAIDISLMAKKTSEKLDTKSQIKRIEQAYTSVIDAHMDIRKYVDSSRNGTKLNHSINELVVSGFDLGYNFQEKIGLIGYAGEEFIPLKSGELFHTTSCRRVEYPNKRVFMPNTMLALEKYKHSN